MTSFVDILNQGSQEDNKVRMQNSPNHRMKPGADFSYYISIRKSQVLSHSCYIVIETRHCSRFFIDNH